MGWLKRIKKSRQNKSGTFHRIKPENLFNRVFADYCNVFMTLANILRKMERTYGI